MHLQKVISRKTFLFIFLLASWRSMTKIAECVSRIEYTLKWHGSGTLHQQAISLQWYIILQFVDPDGFVLDLNISHYFTVTGFDPKTRLCIKVIVQIKSLHAVLAESFMQCSGSMKFWCGSGSGSGSADSCLWLMDPDSDPDADPAIFVIDLQDANKKLILKKFSAYYFLKVHFHHFSKIKSPKESQNSRN